MAELNNPQTNQRIDGPTPNGGAYSIAYFQDAEGEATTKEKAVKVEVVEFSRSGDHVFRTYANIKKA